MMREIVSIEQFTGVRSDLAPSQVPHGASPAAWNWQLSRGTLRLRAGRVAHSTVPSDSLQHGARALGAYVPTIEGDSARLLAAIHDRLYATSGTGQTFSSFLKFATTLDTSGRVRLQQFGKHLYFVDGSSPVKKCMNLASYTQTAAVIPETITWNDGPFGICLGLDSDGAATVYTGDRGNERVYRVNVSTGAVVATITNANMVNPIDLLSVGTDLYVLCEYESGVTTYHIVKFTNDAYVGRICPHGTGSGDLNVPRAFCLNDAQDTFWVCQQIGAGQAVKAFTVSSGAQVAVWGSANGTEPGSFQYPAGIAAHDGYVYVVDRTLARVSKYTESGTYIMHWGSYGTGNGQFNSPTCIVYSPSTDTLLVADTGNKRIQEFSLTGEHLRNYGSAGAGVGQFSGLTHLDVDPDALTIYTAELLNQRLQVFTTTTDDDAAVVEIADEATPVRLPEVTQNAGAGTITDGEWTFGYTFARQREGTYYEGPMSPTLTVTVSDGPITSFSVVCTLEEGVASGDYLYLYLQAPSSSVFLRVGSHYVDANDTDVTFAVSDFPAAEAEVFAEYVHRPPIGATILLEWQGRMVYVGTNPDEEDSTVADTVFISNPADAEHCPQATDDLTPPSYGTYFSVGNDRTPVTALGKIGSYLLVLKENSAWLVDGTGWQTYAPMQVAADHGCLSHESVQSCENGVVWAGRDGIFVFDGQRVQEFGRPVKGVYSTLTDAQIAASFAVYDPDQRLYVLFLPDTELGEIPSATALVYDFAAGAWMVWSGLPGGCALLAPFVDTPGVYASDLYGTDGVGQVYRLFSGTTDAIPDGETSIAFGWYDRLREEPFPGRLKDVTRLVVSYITCDASEVEEAPVTTISAALRTNGQETPSASLVLTLPASQNDPYRSRWTPPLLSDVNSYQVGLTGESRAALEISRIDLQVHGRSEVL
jgi:hypothetical protein